MGAEALWGTKKGDTKMKALVMANPLNEARASDALLLDAANRVVGLATIGMKGVKKVASIVGGAMLQQGLDGTWRDGKRVLNVERVISM